MNSVQKLLLLAGTAFCGACTVEHDESAPAQAGTEQEQPSAEYSTNLSLGEETYLRSCASCHDDGVNGAPAIRDRDAWSDRSPLWSAVLTEHAKSGYLDMPAKGGHPELTEHDVEAAGEYILRETFPELPPD